MSGITEPYLSAKIAVNRLSKINQVLDYTITMPIDLLNSGLSPARISDLMNFYKKNLLSFIQFEVTNAANEAIIYALSGAGESDNKNSLLTPIIVGIPVNPAGATNAAELVAMLADGVNAADNLQQILSNAQQILS